MDKRQTGGNLEPMPFVRRWGAADSGDVDVVAAQTFPPPQPMSAEQQWDNNGKDALSSSAGAKKHRRHHSRSKSPSSSKKDKDKDSKKKHKKHDRSRSREKASKNRKRSRSRDKDKKRAKGEREERDHGKGMTAFPPPADYLQQVQQRHQQQEMEMQQQMLQQQQQQPVPLMQLQFKKEEPEFEQQQDYGGYYQQQSQQQQQSYQSGWGQADARPPVQAPQQGETGEKKNDALSAALAAAAMVAQKLKSSHGGIGGDLLAKIPQAQAPRATPLAETILGKESNVKQEPGVGEETAEERRERRRKSRWSTTKSFVPGMPTILPSDIDENQRQVYLLQMEIEETTRTLRQGDFGQNLDPAERSPSPEPIYDAVGKRLNTREVRKRQELEQRRHERIQALLRINPNYKPPTDYRPPNIKLHDKVWIPQEDHPEINFVGLLIGPRGNTLKALEAETGAKIIIRGKGSVKEGKLANRTGPLPGENEPLHAYVTSTDREAIKRGCDKIREIINAALMIPDGQNELRKLQLRELALLNGTLRPEDILSGARCTNCGSDQHKTWECMEALNVTANVICTACGGAGHIARDCKNPRPGFDGAMMDAEYTALMAELGEKPPIGQLNAAPVPQPLVGGKPIPGFPGAPRPPRFIAPTGTPIMRVNLVKPQPQPLLQPAQNPQGGGYPGWALSAAEGGAGAGIGGGGAPGGGGPTGFYGFSGLPGQDPAAAAAAWAAWQAGQSGGGFPAPVPPPPGSGADPATSGAGGSGLAMFPPPPPPPPPMPKLEVKEELDSLLSAPPPPN